MDLIGRFLSDCVDQVGDTKSFTKLKNLRDSVNWSIVEDRHKLLRQLYPLVRHWKGPLPQLRDVFQPGEIDWLVTESVRSATSSDYETKLHPFVEFLVKTYYCDEPPALVNGKPAAARTTPLHLATRRKPTDRDSLARLLFEIYDRCDVNYTDEFGLTHFHVACRYDCVETVMKFLEHRQDPNCILPRTGDTPLHVALEHEHPRMVSLLLRNGADPNLANKHGSTSLHVICEKKEGLKLLKRFFDVCEEHRIDVQMDNKDRRGDTPLHLALTHLPDEASVILLSWGADPNVADAKGYTALHHIARKFFGTNLTQALFRISARRARQVEVDALDHVGWTPLQWAVAMIQPKTADVLLENGADLSRFVFPDLSNLEERFRPCYNCNKLEIASGLLAILEALEKHDYAVEQRLAVAIMGLFEKYELFDAPEEGSSCDSYYDLGPEDAKFVREMSRIPACPGVTLYSLLRFERRRRTVKPLSCQQYLELSRLEQYQELDEERREREAVRLCETMARGFFRRWALGAFRELTHGRLPLEVCKRVVGKPLTNEDLYNICLAAAAATAAAAEAEAAAATSQSPKNGRKRKSTTEDNKKSNNKKPKRTAKKATKALTATK